MALYARTRGDYSLALPRVQGVLPEASRWLLGKRTLTRLWRLRTEAVCWLRRAGGRAVNR